VIKQGRKSNSTAPAQGKINESGELPNERVVVDGGWIKLCERERRVCGLQALLSAICVCAVWSAFDDETGVLAAD
jgi:hypothetical protein